MNYQRPELKNKLAAEYVLGTLHGGARRRFERLLQEDRELRSLVETWTVRLIPVGLPSENLGPSNRVWAALEQRLDPSTSKLGFRSTGPRWFRSLLPGPMLVGSLAGALGGLAFGMALMLVIGPDRPAEDLTLRSGDGKGATQPVASPEGQVPDSYIAVLAEGPGPPALLATALRSGKILRVKVLDEFTIDPEKVPVLWALPKSGPPALLGALPTEGATELDLLPTAEQALGKVDELAVSIEGRSAQPFSAPQAAYRMRSTLIKTW
jgi:anti-sigma-K factor RskA